MNGKPQFSIVSPVYSAENIVDKLVAEIVESIEQLTHNYEIILVEDGGPDHSWDKIKSNCSNYEKVRGIKLSRNFGQQAAIHAGLDASRGDWVVVMDCDLQDKPSEIAKLYTKALEGYDVVVASRQDRQDSRYKKILSSLFNRAMSYLTGTEQDSTVANFVLYSRKAVNALAKMQDYNRYYPMMMQWIGFSMAKVKIEHAEREEGESSYSFRKRLKLALDTMLTFSDKPLRMVVRWGVYIAIIAVLAAVILVIVYFIRSFKPPGWLSLALLITFFSGSIISVLGVVGLYVGRIFETVKGRPSYLVDEELNKPS